ncbi:MAG TPA: dTDP-4-dehydrorhamnose reductase [Anaerolineaceae bacterium]|nr:dTDP-4-dehydrorhamnose reductase [Anaerolineaceae bacterium]HPN52300.1 dTDP-4-dehydrorhamnose reductase [Anaerolineaceae bacterium]
MRILILGRNGQLSWELRRTLAGMGEIISYDYPQIDFGRPESLPPLLESTQPQVVINAVAYTAVDKAESEPELARKVNAETVALLAQAAARKNIPFIHYSTDFVYDGKKGADYVETDAPNPLSVYGQTKLEGDQAVAQAGGPHWILRTSWVYSMRQGGFVTKVLQWARAQRVMRMVTDQVGGPTSARLLAELTGQALAMGLKDLPGWVRQTSGLYHLAGSGGCSRYDWASLILELDPRREEQVVERLEPALAAEFPVPAARPAAAILDCSLFERTFGLRLPSWQEGLKLTMEQ